MTRAPRAAAVRSGAVLVRVTVVVGAVLVVLAGGAVPLVPVAVLAVGVVLAVTRPATVGAWVALPAAVLTFAVAAPGDVGAPPTVLAAVGLYLVHTGTAFAASCPPAAQLDPAVARRWVVRCLPAAVLTAAVVGLDALLGRTPDRGAFLAVAGALVVVAVASLVRLLAPTRVGAD